jgi:prophage maintenance system killer protein
VKEVKYLSADEIEDLHEQIILRYGGVGGVLNRELLESASLRPKAAVLGRELYPTLDAFYHYQPPFR